MLDQFILIAGLLLLVSIIASKASGRYGVPALIIFLVIGMLAGSEGPGGIYFDDPVATQSLGVVALIFILFSGGLDTKWDYVRPVLGSALILATVGVALTALLVGLFAYAILDFTLLEGLLLGAIVSSTDAAAVFAILRSKGVGLRGYIKPLVELESGSNDPMAVFLTTGIIGLMTTSNSSMLNLFGMFIWQMILEHCLATSLAALPLLCSTASIWNMKGCIRSLA